MDHEYCGDSETEMKMTLSPWLLWRVFKDSEACPLQLGTHRILVISPR